MSTFFSKTAIRRAKQHFGFKSNMSDGVVDRFLLICMMLLKYPRYKIDIKALRKHIGITIDGRKHEYFFVNYSKKDGDGHYTDRNTYTLRPIHAPFIMELLEESMTEAETIELLDHDGKTYVVKDLEIAGITSINYEQARALSLDLHAAYKHKDVSTVNLKWGLNLRLGQVEKTVADIFMLIQQFKSGDSHYHYREDQSGRFFVKERMHEFQHASKVTRKALLGKMGYYDYDMETSHFSIIRQKMIVDMGVTDFDEQYPAITNYIMNKTTVRHWLAKVLNVDVDLVKTIINAIGYGGVFKGPSMESKIFARIFEYTEERQSENVREVAIMILEVFKNNDAIRAIQDEMQKVSKILVSHYLDGKDYFVNDRGWIYDARNKSQAQILSNILMTIEGKILLKIIDKYGPNIVLLMHDGFISNTQIDKEELQQYIKSEIGYDLHYSEEQL